MKAHALFYIPDKNRARMVRTVNLNKGFVGVPGGTHHRGSHRHTAKSPVMSSEILQPLAHRTPGWDQDRFPPHPETPPGHTNTHTSYTMNINSTGISLFTRRSLSYVTVINGTVERKKNMPGSTPHLQHRLPVSVQLHDRLGPFHHGFSSRDFNPLMFEPAHSELSRVVPPHCSGRTGALHGCLSSVLEPDNRPADTLKGLSVISVKFRTSFAKDFSKFSLHPFSFMLCLQTLG